MTNRIATYYRHTWQPQTAVRFIAFTKGHERYIFLWDSDPASAVGICRAFGRYASDYSMNFDWYDAARLSQRVRGR